MAAAEIQIVNPSNLAKIESFLNDPSYKEIIENSSTFNSRLCAERRMRMPFIDTQTGVAQSHCNLFMTRKQRMPGLREGQVYSYPAQRWRKSRRQYLTMSSTRWGWSGADNLADNTGEGENSSGVPGDALAGDDSRDGSQTAAKDDPKEWFYDEIAMDEMETGEEPEAESDEDYFDDTYANRRKRRGGATPSGPGSRGGRVRKSQPDDGTPKRGRAGRGRKRAAQSTLPYEVPGDSEKPFGCERLAAAAAASAAPPPARRPSPPPRPASADTSSSDSAHAPLVPPGTAAAAAAAAAASAPPAPEAKEGEAKVSPSPYCDFCLGDDRENKKTGTPEELVSCSDCGRSGKRGRGRPPRNGVRKPTKCYHIENRVCEHHRHLRDIKLNGVLEIQTSMSFSADDFDNFAMKTKLLNDEYVEYPMSPPSSRQSPVI
ncbi:zinc finger protein ubi-d4-like isoform X4 [Plodia interpunctella]|uniref:zinc finger protein ubi-d4-like isoform X4 n=1 Tax=Plodia interpunctella TaxID=58824 RepID=UPI002368C077|nr:zinc finger protein ubi-d4-like isoform X4 [Plodia interpunctella]